MHTFTISNVHPQVVKSTKDKDLFGDATRPVTITEARVNVEDLANIRVQTDEDTVTDIESDDGPTAQTNGRATLSKTPLSFGPNPREQKLSTKVSQDIIKSLLERDGQFHHRNRGITVTAQRVIYDNAKRELTFIEDNAEYHGVLDGGHTYRIIHEYIGRPEMRSKYWDKWEKEEPPKPQFVKLEIFEGLTQKQIWDLAGSRNTSVNVEGYALYNLEKQFDFVKTVLSENKPDLSDMVGFKQFDNKPYDIVELLQRLTVLDNVNFDDDEKQPYKAYWSRKKTTEEFIDNVKAYSRLKAMIPDALALPEYIAAAYQRWYIQSGGKSKAAKGRWGSTEEHMEGKTPLPVLPLLRVRDLAELRPEDEAAITAANEGNTPFDLPYRVSDGLIMPILGALRVIVSRDPQDAAWLTDPYRFLDDLGPKLVGETNNALVMVGNATTVGKTKLHWRSLYQVAWVHAIRKGLIGSEAFTPIQL